MALLSLVGPILSYYIDSSEVQRQLRSRGAHEARLYADSLALRILTMESELQRIARRPEVNLTDESFGPEKVLLQHAHHESALFRGGVALLDLSGRVLSSVPQDRFGRTNYASRRWFQKALSTGRTVADRFGDELDGWVILVPVRAKNSVVGFVIGVARAADQPLAFSLEDAQQVALVDGAEALFQLPESRSIPRTVFEGASEARGAEGLDITENGVRYLAFAARVRGTLDLWLLNHFDAVNAPIRRRLISQLLFLSALQFLTWMAFSLFVRRTYLSFREMEARVAEEEKMAKLGMAASLIAHEVKNTLNGIAAATSHALPGTGGQELSGRVVRSQLMRLGNLAKSLLSLGRPVRPQVASVDLRQVATETIEALRVLPETASVDLKFDMPESITIEADRALAVTAMDNVIRNAVEAAVAAKDMGKISMASVRVTSECADGMAALVVEDNGGGPPLDFEEHAFEPFVTSKSKGIGLGLTTTRQSMEAMGGAISFQRTSTGSRFVLRFRLHPNVEPRREPEHVTH